MAASEEDRAAIGDLVGANANSSHSSDTPERLALLDAENDSASELLPSEAILTDAPGLFSAIIA